MRRLRIHYNNIVSLLHGITSFILVNQQSSKFIYYIIMTSHISIKGTITCSIPPFLNAREGNAKVSFTNSRSMNQYTINHITATETVYISYFHDTS